MENKNRCRLKSEQSSSVDIEEEEDGGKIKHLINVFHRSLSSKKGQDEERAKIGDKTDGEMTKKAKSDIEVEDLRKDKWKDEIELGSIITFEREKLSMRKRSKRLERWSSKEWDDLRAERLRLETDKEELVQRELKLRNSQKQTKSDNESLMQREMELTKSEKQRKIDDESLFQRERKLSQAQKQTKSDNESLFQREMKLWQDKKDLCKERKTFDETMVVARRELEKGNEAGAKQEEERKENRFSRINSHFSIFKVPTNFNWMRFCFGASPVRCNIFKKK